MSVVSKVPWIVLCENESLASLKGRSQPSVSGWLALVSSAGTWVCVKEGDGSVD